MESLRDIKNRKIATEKTAQITKAMNMVSASKLRRTEKIYKQYRDYLERIANCVANIASNATCDHPMLVQREIKKVAYIMITSDRGLAASYNSNVYKRITEEISKCPTDYVIGAIGRKGYTYCMKNGYNLTSDEAILVRDDLQFADITPLSSQLINDYKAGLIDKIVVCYNHYVNTLTQEVVLKTILPVEKPEIKEKMVDYEYDQGVERTLDLVLPMYVENVLYGLILDAKTSEHASRMTAMKNATDNATDVISQLQLIYNRARQASITKELTDIIGGANAV